MALKSDASPDDLLPLPSATFHILVALSDADRHGYAIMQEVAERTEGRTKLNPGTLYTTIHRLLDQALIEELDARPADDDERRRYYRLTTFGRQVAQRELARLSELVALGGTRACHRNGADSMPPRLSSAKSADPRLCLALAPVSRLVSRRIPARARRRFPSISSRRPGTRSGQVAAGAMTDVLLTAPGVHLDLLRQDLRYAWRSLRARSQRSFAVAAIMTLALGVGAATAIFSIVYAVMLAPLPYRDSDRLMRIYETNPARNISAFSVSVPNLVSWRRQVTRLSFAAFKDAPANLTDGSEAAHVDGLAATANTFQVLGLPLVRGRSFTAAEDRPGGPQAAIVSEGLWRRRYAGREDLIGAPISVDGVARTVVGIAPQDVGFSREVDLWVPLAADPATEGRGDKRLAVVGRLAAGVTPDEAQAELAAVAGALAREFPADNGGWSARLEPVFDWIVGDDLPQRMRLLVIAVGLLLLVACANVANLQMARAAGRTGELGVRLALGANRARLLRQTLTEGLLLASVGAAAGLALAWALVSVSRGVLPDSIPRLADLSINLPVLVAALLSTLAVALVSGLLPALMAGRADIRDALQHAGRPASVGARAPIRYVLVGVQLALSTCAGRRRRPPAAEHVEHGGTGAWVQSARKPAHGQHQPAAGPDFNLDRDVAFYDAVLREAAALPGVVSVALSSGVPLAYGNTGMSIGTKAPPKGQPVIGVQASWRIVSPSYFRTLDVPVLRGRCFDPRLRPDANPAIVISRTLAEKLWPNGEDPIGRSAYLGGGQSRHHCRRRRRRAAHEHRPRAGAGDVLPVVADAMGDDDGRRYAPRAIRRCWRRRFAPRCRASIARKPLFDVETMSTIVGRRLAEPRLNATLLSIFAGLALTLAAVGVAGVMAYAVARRTGELAIRQALGASPRQAMRAVLAGGLKVCTAGIAAGLAGALALGQSLAGLLYGVAPRDVHDAVGGQHRAGRRRGRRLLAAGTPRHAHQSDARAARAVNRSNP